MLAHAEKGEFNFSNNPTFKEFGQTITPFTSSNSFRERNNIKIKNIVDVKYSEVPPNFEKTVYISSIGIYDELENLIAICKLANPIRKRENDDITVSMKLDF